MIPEEGVSEITDPNQAQILNNLFGAFEKVSLESAEELTYFADLSGRLGLGESACLAIAQSRAWLIACDEKRIFVREARHRLGDARLINTPGLYVLLIRAGLLTVDEADQAKALLKQHRFRMALVSFRELI